jgi:protein-L-isoaspartate(D-aspartate) O-methyltransferase
MNSRRKEITAYFEEMDRSFFMDANKEFADLDQALPIGHEQTISQPSLVLEMTLALDLQPGSKVLEIGTGSGFQTALLAQFSQTVYTVERIEDLYNRAKERLAEAGFNNIHFKLADGSHGWSDQAPYDRIMVTAAASEVPSELVGQLKNGGKMVIPVGGPMLQELLLITKDDSGELSTKVLNKVVFVRLKGKYE